MDPSVLPPPKIIPPRTVRIRADAFPFRADSPVHRCNCCFPFGRSKENSPWLRSNWAEPSIWKIPSVYSPVGNFTRLPRLWNYRCRCRIFKTDSSEDFWKSNRIGIGRGIFLKKKMKSNIRRIFLTRFESEYFSRSRFPSIHWMILAMMIILFHYPGFYRWNTSIVWIISREMQQVKSNCIYRRDVKFW